MQDSANTSPGKSPDKGPDEKFYDFNRKYGMA
jgi:hypothetical protein